MDNWAEQSEVTEDSISKPPSRLGLGLLGLAVLGLMGVLLFNRSAESLSPDEQAAAKQAAAEQAAAKQAADEQAADTDSAAVSIPTVMTLATGADTVNSRRLQDKPAKKMPDRGAFRAALAASYIAPCDALIDGPEPVQAGLYKQHGRCIAEALAGLDERCRLAADFFFLYPGDEALDIACDSGNEKSQTFRESVRQGMVIGCDVQHQRLGSGHETEYIYARCLQAIASGLDLTCYLSARAQFLDPDDAEVRTICEIGPEVSLTNFD